MQKKYVYVFRLMVLLSFAFRSCNSSKINKEGIKTEVLVAGKYTHRDLVNNTDILLKNFEYMLTITFFTLPDTCKRYSKTSKNDYEFDFGMKKIWTYGNKGIISRQTDMSK